MKRTKKEWIIEGRGTNLLRMAPSFFPELKGISAILLVHKNEENSFPVSCGACSRLPSATETRIHNNRWESRIITHSRELSL